MLQREEQGSPLLCSLQLFSFLFKEERYFQCLITRLELRLTYSPDMQQKQPLFNTPPPRFHKCRVTVLSSLWGWGCDKGCVRCLTSAGVYRRRGKQCESWHLNLLASRVPSLLGNEET